MSGVNSNASGVSRTTSSLYSCTQEARITLSGRHKNRVYAGHTKKRDIHSRGTELGSCAPQKMFTFFPFLKLKLFGAGGRNKCNFWTARVKSIKN
jgi:hypothetical protein